MQDSKQLLNQLAPKIAQSPSNSQTQAGLHDEVSADNKHLLQIAINEAFELMRLNYQHLYFSAYPEIDAVNSAKRLWLDSLSHVEPNTLRRAVQCMIKTSDFLPTISRLLKQCEALDAHRPLPPVHAAYWEACNASSPKVNFPWSHPIVYHAGKASNWHFLACTDESIAFPVFKEHYHSLCQQLIQGIPLPAIEPKPLPTHTETPLTAAENSRRLDELRTLVQL